SRLVGADLLLDGAVAEVVLHVREPLIEGEERAQQQRRAGSARAAIAGVGPNELVVVVAVLGVEPVTDGPRAPVHVNVAGGILIAAEIDDRQLGELAAVADEPAAVIGVQRVGAGAVPWRGRAGRRAGSRPRQVGSVAADTLVQPHELLGGDPFWRACLQRLEPVLHAFVVAGLVGLAVAVGVDERADHRGVVVGARAAHAVGPRRRGRRAVGQRRRPAGAAVAIHR